jgi:hypothetical protein
LDLEKGVLTSYTLFTKDQISLDLHSEGRWLLTKIIHSRRGFELDIVKHRRSQALGKHAVDLVCRIILKIRHSATAFAQDWFACLALSGFEKGVV